VAESSKLVGQQWQNTGRRRWSVNVGRRTSQSQTNGVDADGRRRRVDSHLPKMMRHRKPKLIGTIACSPGHGCVLFATALISILNNYLFILFHVVVLCNFG